MGYLCHALKTKIATTRISNFTAERKMVSAGSAMLSFCSLAIGWQFLMQQAMTQYAKKCVRSCPAVWLVSHEINRTTACLAPCLSAARSAAPRSTLFLRPLCSSHSTGFFPPACLHRCNVLKKVVPCLHTCVRKKGRNIFTLWFLKRTADAIPRVDSSASADALVSGVGYMARWLLR